MISLFPASILGLWDLIVGKRHNLAQCFPDLVDDF